MIIYVVLEQWPNREIASFRNLEDAQSFLDSNRSRFALPIIISYPVMIIPNQTFDYKHFIQDWTM